MMSAKYFEYYTIILRGAVFFRGHTVFLPCGFYLSIFLSFLFLTTTSTSKQQEIRSMDS